MKKILFALALTMIGGASLSMVSTANAASAPVAGIGEAAEAKGAVQLVHDGYGYWRWKRYHRDRHDFEVFGDGFRSFPSGYYKGFCYDYPDHWWCRKYFRKGY
jgi:hypothetical protein